MLCVKIKIYGKVQGVFFRVSAQEKAKELGIISRETKNMSDGSVEVVIEGEEEKIKKFIDWCKVGPEMAEVEKVEIVSGETSSK